MGLKMIFPYFLFSAALAVPQLQNPGFEASTALAGWEVRASDKDRQAVRVSAHDSERKEGARTLLLESAAPATCSLGQWVFLPTGTLWRLKVWVKTEGPSSALQRAESGQVVIGSREGVKGKSAPRFGSSPWREEEIQFEAPTPAGVYIRLIGFNGSAGRTWFDDLRLEPVRRPASDEVRIRFQKATRRPIDLKQGGQFIEPLCSLLPSMIAQQVASTSFEEEQAWKFAYRKEIDRPHRPWYPDGAVHLARYSFDSDNPFNGKRSQRIEVPVPRVRAGIAQDGFWLTQGVGYRLRLHMRGQGSVRVWASLAGGGKLLAGPEPVGQPGAVWTESDVVLKARGTTGNGTLKIEFEGPGTLWLDRVYLIGDDAVLGLWRPDVVAAVKAMRPGVIRFGGSAVESFEWDKCIGPWSRRVPYTTFWGDLDENFVGVEEFVQLCRHAGAEPLVCVRWTGKSPADAAAELEYFNGAPETGWGKVRARNGRPEPYRVKYWQIGNEIGGPQYDSSVRAFAEALRKADPTIKILSSYPSTDTLQQDGGYLDYLCPHHYGAGDLEGKEADFKRLQALIERYGAGKEIRVAVTEWNTTPGEWGLGRGMLQTLGNALSCSRYQNLLHRQADVAEIAIRSNLIDSFGSGVILTHQGSLYFAPTYYAQSLYSKAAGSYPLRMERGADIPWHLQEPDLSATISQDGKTLRIYAVNTTAEPRPVKYSLEGFPSGVKGGSIFVVKDREGSGTPEVMNDRNDPERIAPTEKPASVQGISFHHTYEPFSVTLLDLRIGN
jgi:alpha-L-arabinofuranosidase